jgi:predicted RNase H-related nuclease YkuK (DUF458 family)
MYSYTYGELDIGQVADIIIKYIQSQENEYHIYVGTDSQNHAKTKMVSVIAVHRVGHGGIFFFDVKMLPKIKTVREKLLTETQYSLEWADKLLKEFEQKEESTGFDYTLIPFTLHVDAGFGGPSKDVIKEITGWLEAMGYDYEIKPDSVAAASIADKISK